MKITRALRLVLVLFLCACARSAIRVDLSPDNGRHDVMTPEWENWRVKDGGESTENLGAITARTFRASRSKGNSLSTFFWKGGLDTGATLSCDGVSGSELQLSLSGLAPGHHTLVTYHNSPDKSAPTIEVSSSGKSTMVQSTSRIPNATPLDAAFAFIEFDAVAGKDAVFTIRTVNGKVAMLNGFAIDVANRPRSPTSRRPGHNDEHGGRESGSNDMDRAPAVGCRA